MSAAARAAVRATELAAIDAKIKVISDRLNQAVVMVKTITPTEREDDVAPWAGFADDIRRLP